MTAEDVKAAHDQDAARELLGKIDRSVVKHATMTTPYGVTRGTIYKQLLEAKPVKDCKDPKKCARYLAKVLEECIPEVAVEAGKIMKWLREWLASSREGKSRHGLDNTDRLSVWFMKAGNRRQYASPPRIAPSFCMKRMKHGRST